eukprot:s1080_g7.t1
MSVSTALVIGRALATVISSQEVMIESLMMRCRRLESVVKQQRAELVERAEQVRALCQESRGGSRGAHASRASSRAGRRKPERRPKDRPEGSLPGVPTPSSVGAGVAQKFDLRLSTTAADFRERPQHRGAVAKSLPRRRAAAGERAERLPVRLRQGCRH